MPDGNQLVNLGPVVRERWPAHVLSLLEAAGAVARDLGVSLYVVGGAVRDLLLVRPNLDLDLVVEGDAVELARRLGAQSNSRVVVHSRFGTAKLYHVQGTLDIITARREDYPRPGALPVVQPGNLEADLFRRDFTINALAIRVEPGPFGELVDPYGGKLDLESRLIRVLHPKSFIDDATRILRAVRYERRLGFQLEEATARLLRRDVAMLDTISGDRLRHELELILKEPFPEKVLRRLDEVGALGRLLPPLSGDNGLEARLARARQAEPSPLLYLALLTYLLARTDVEQIVSRFNFPIRTARVLRDTVEVKGKLPLLARRGLPASEVYETLKYFSPTAILASALAADSLEARKSLRLYLDKLRYVRVSLKGNDLIEMGVAVGPRLGELLERLLKARLDGQAATREEEVGLVRGWLSG